MSHTKHHHEQEVHVDKKPVVEFRDDPKHYLEGFRFMLGHPYITSENRAIIEAYRTGFVAGMVS